MPFLFNKTKNMFLEILRDINFRTLSHWMDCKKWDTVEINPSDYKLTKWYIENFKLLPCKVRTSRDWNIDWIEYFKWKIVELPINLYIMVLRVYPDIFQKLSLDEYKKLQNPKKEGNKQKTENKVKNKAIKK